jgi:hypothetical protein
MNGWMANPSLNSDPGDGHEQFDIGQTGALIRDSQTVIWKHYDYKT